MASNDTNNNFNFNVELGGNQTFSSPIQDFFHGGSILVTGATGFVGKALVEKLLRSCPDISTIFLLIRPKRGMDVETRFREFLKSQVFDRLRSEKSTIFLKLVAICGDVSQPGLGLSATDKLRLTNEVTVVFHSAATVKFNEKLEDAVLLNTQGTKSVIELCRSMSNLQALVHVSTAYSNADKKRVDEAVYPPPANPDGVIQCCQTLSATALEDLAERLQGSSHPNTYTLTKAMAEWVVAEEAGDLPVAIVRPSIVTAAWMEPVPGWVDNVCGITGIMMEIGRGTIRSIVCDEKLIVDIIPVDFVVNTIIGVAWHAATYKYNTIRVYNCTSGSLNPLCWHELGKMTHKHAIATPSRYVQWYPGFTFRTNRFMHAVYESLFHFLPAFIIDVALRVQGGKPMMIKIFRRFKTAAKTGEFFALHEWEFSCENQKSLARSMTSYDQECFNTDIVGLDWNSYVKQYMLGIRKFVLKDTPDTIASSRQKLNRLYWLHRISQLLIILLIFKLIKIR